MAIPRNNNRIPNSSMTNTRTPSANPNRKGKDSSTTPERTKGTARTDAKPPVERGERWKNYYEKLYPRDSKGRPKNMTKNERNAYIKRIDKLVSAPPIDPSNPMKNFDDFFRGMKKN